MFKVKNIDKIAKNFLSLNYRIKKLEANLTNRQEVVPLNNFNTGDDIFETEGKKYDTGKPLVGTLCDVFPRSLLMLGKVIEFGTHKYPDPNNWKKVDGAFRRYQDSMMRHYIKFKCGKDFDSETKLPHLAHLAWNALAILELFLMSDGRDSIENDINI